jgi:curved DNA-binding protein CbpA
MTDFFALLNLAPQAALDEGVLQQAYDQCSREHHPDQAGAGGAERSAAINLAYQTLRQPETRLKHWLELRAPEAAGKWQSIPMEESLMQLFMSLSRELQALEVLQQQAAAASSALGRALLAPQLMVLQDQLLEIGVGLEQALGEQLEQLPLLDQIPQLSEADIQRAKHLQARLAYLARWKNQQREAQLKLELLSADLLFG